MPTEVGIHDFAVCGAEKAWIPIFIGMTGFIGQGGMPHLSADDHKISGKPT
jgi:hypothetical protein